MSKQIHMGTWRLQGDESDTYQTLQKDLSNNNLHRTTSVEIQIAHLVSHTPYSYPLHHTRSLLHGQNFHDWTAKKWWWVKMHVHILNHPPRNCLNTLEFIKTHHVRQGNENTFTPHLHTPCLHHIINPFRQVLIILNLITHKITCL